MLLWLFLSALAKWVPGRSDQRGHVLLLEHDSATASSERLPMGYVRKPGRHMDGFSPCRNDIDYFDSPMFPQRLYRALMLIISYILYTSTPYPNISSGDMDKPSLLDTLLLALLLLPLLVNIVLHALLLNLHAYDLQGGNVVSHLILLLPQ